MTRYRFADFVLSPRQRTLLRSGYAITLIPRYFDLLLFLIERRRDAVHRRDIFDRVWADVIVSDSALSQAIRTLRRTLSDDSREPRFIRTVSRHGYQFVFTDVVEEEDDGGVVVREGTPDRLGSRQDEDDAFSALIEQLTAPAGTAVVRENQRDAAERLHALGTNEALGRLQGHPRQAYGRALLRDTRHLVPGADVVSIIGSTTAVGTASALIAMRVRRAAHLVTRRWLNGAAGGGVAGAAAGLVGGVILALAPGSDAPVSVAPVLSVIGALTGALGGAGVAGGLAAAEALTHSARRVALVLGSAAGGVLVGYGAQAVGQWTLGALFGLTVTVGGTLEGLVLGGGVGLGYAMATRGAPGGLAAPQGRQRSRVAMTTGVAGAAAALVLTFAGLPLVGGTVHAIAQASAGSRVLFTPLGHLIGEPGFGPITRAIIAMAEGGVFGVGVALGVTRRR